MSSIELYITLITAVTVFGSAGAWRFYEKRAMAKERSENFVKDDCRERIIKLEKLLEKSSKEKEEMRDSILKLTSQVAELKTKVEYLENEKTQLLSKKTTIKHPTRK